MIGLLDTYAQVYALIIAGLTAVVFGLPLFLAPLGWARAFRWRIPEHTDLAIYCGRCLGGFVLILDLFLLRAGLTGTGLVFAFQFLLVAGLFMLVAHIWGALLRIQPWTENLEILMYIALILGTLLFYPASDPVVTRF
jgi:hypothetical protein